MYGYHIGRLYRPLIRRSQDRDLFAKMRRIKSMYTSDQLDQIQEFRKEVDQAMEAIRIEYAKHGEVERG